MPNILIGVDCPHCDSAETLDIAWVEMGTRHCVCTACAKACQVDHGGRVRRDDARIGPLFDVSGVQIYE